jgi:hypothetical protein
MTHRRNNNTSRSNQQTASNLNPQIVESNLEENNIIDGSQSLEVINENSTILEDAASVINNETTGSLVEDSSILNSTPAANDSSKRTPSKTAVRNITNKFRKNLDENKEQTELG